MILLLKKDCFFFKGSVLEFKESDKRTICYHFNGVDWIEEEKEE